MHREVRRKISDRREDRTTPESLARDVDIPSNLDCHNVRLPCLFGKKEYRRSGQVAHDGNEEAELTARSIARACETLYRKRGPEVSVRSLSPDLRRDRVPTEKPPTCGTSRYVTLEAGDPSMCDALYRAAISCAGLLFLALEPVIPLLLSSALDDRVKPDIDQVLSASSLSSNAPRNGSVSNTLP